MSCTIKFIKKEDRQTRNNEVNKTTLHHHSNKQKKSDAQNTITTPQREEWMLGELNHLLSNSYEFSSSRRKRKMLHKPDPDTLRIIQDRELNPFFLNGGDGLPCGWDQNASQLEKNKQRHKMISAEEHKNKSTQSHQSYREGSFSHKKPSQKQKEQFSFSQPLSDSWKCKLENTHTADTAQISENEDDLNLVVLKQLKSQEKEKGKGFYEPLKAKKSHVEVPLRSLGYTLPSKESNDLDRLMQHNILRKGYILDDEYDDLAKTIPSENCEVETSRKRQVEHLISRQHYGKISKALYQRESKCLFCPESSLFERARKNTLISTSPHAFLCYQSKKQCILQLHFVISPMTHTASSAQLDEATYQEIRNFQKSLIAYLDTKNLGVVFTESMTRKVNTECALIGGGSHLAIDCFAMPIDRFSQAKAYFQKALSDYGHEWSQNKKVIPVPQSSQGCRSLLPPHFPYFYVDFGLGNVVVSTGDPRGGYLHLIEDNTFSKDFGHDIIRGIMGLDRWSTCFESFSHFYEVVNDFKKQFRKYDWTSALIH